MTIVARLHDAVAFPLRNFAALAPQAAAPLRIAVTVTVAFNLAFFLPFQFALFAAAEPLFEFLRYALLAVIPLTWCRFMTAAFAIAHGADPGPPGFRFTRREAAFAAAAITFHAVATLVVLPALTLVADPADWLTQRRPTNAAAALLVFAGILVRFATIMPAAALGTPVAPMAALRDTAGHFVRYTVLGLILIAAGVAIFAAATGLWAAASPTARAVLRIAGPFALQLALVMYGAFLAGFVGLSGGSKVNGTEMSDG